MEIKQKEKNKKSYVFIVIGIVFIIIGIIFILFDIIPDFIKNESEKVALKEFYDNQQNINEENIIENIIDTNISEKNTQEKINYISVIRIPKINLEKGIVSKNSKYNDIKYGIEILEESDMPNTENGNVILASHSGNSNISYFKDLDKLVADDEIEITYNKHTYIYKVKKIYDVNKVGDVTIEKIDNKSQLTLITCRDKTDKQIVIISELVNIK